jgi:hypothetical protein
VRSVFVPNYAIIRIPKALSEDKIHLHVRGTSWGNAAVEMAVREWLGSQQQDGKLKMLPMWDNRVDVVWDSDET